MLDTNLGGKMKGGKIEVVVDKTTGDTVIGEVEELHSHMLRHKGCQGFMKETSPSDTHNRHSCNKCNWFFTIPNTITTLTGLREEVEKHGSIEK